MTALGDLVVIDMSESVAGQYCSRLMAGFGASVTLVEPVGGSRLRAAYPESSVWGDSLLFFNLNLDKTAIQLDAQSPEGLERALDMIGKADIAIIPQGMDTQALRRAAPDTVICEIGDFDQRGPYAGWQGGEMIHQALAGTMYRNGRPGQEPLFGCGHRASCMTGVAAYTAILSALRRGRGDLLRLDVHSTAASASYQLANQYYQNGTVDLRGGQQHTAEMIVPCANGWAVIFVYPYKWETFCKILGLNALFENPVYAEHIDRLLRWSQIVEAAGEATRLRDAEELMQTMQAAGVPTMMAFTPDDLFTSEHLRVRNYWRSVGEADQSRLVMGEVYRLAEAEWRTDRACTAGAPEKVPASGRLNQTRETRNGEPLSGVRVLDLTTAWAGPLAGRVLAALGAEVVHVESVSRMDLARGTPKGDHPHRYVNLEPGERPWNRSIFFNAQNLHKKSLCIDIKKDGGADALRAAARHCDVILANFSPGTLARMGLVNEEIRKDNPGLVYLEMPACGVSGPMANYTGLGPNMEFASGMAAMVGYGDGQPFATGPAYLDPIGGYNGAAAILTALHQRERTGQGQYVEMSQCEAAMPMIGELILDSLERRTDPQPQGNDQPHILVHAAFACQGHEEWIAIICADAQWDRLCGLMRADGVDVGAAFDAPAYRAAHRAQIKQLISAWTAAKQKQELAERLQAAGLAAAPVNTGKDVALDPQLCAVGFFDEIWHPEAGNLRYQGLPFRFSDAPLPRLRHAPLLGQHTVEILESWGGLSRADILKLHAAGTISTDADNPFFGQEKAAG